MVIRQATLADARTVAAIHAESWRTAYKGLLSDEYLSHRVMTDRNHLWQQRLADPTSPRFRVFIAEDVTGPVGFACLLLQDSRRQVLLDNLHVLREKQGHGVGKRLMAEVGRWAIDHAPAAAVHLWVLEKNAAARGFYRALGATERETKVLDTADGRRLEAVRCQWDDPQVLIGAT